jgi:imidazole glycerol-phosphate synthase subunit HisH
MLAGSPHGASFAQHKRSAVMIAIVDYGAGNLVSVKKALDWLGKDCVITSDPEDVARARKIVLPGVGHFSATSALANSGLRHAITEAIGRRSPFLGICVGLQWMFEGSKESPVTPGLALFQGECERFPADVKSPHVGWNQLQFSGPSKLFRGISSSPFVYFTHSYRVPAMEETTAFCEYGGIFTAAVEKDHIFGVQFHPEKSGEVGLHVLRNFCSL